MKFWIILASVFLVLGIVGVGFAAEQSFTAEVTVNEYTSVTITACGDLNFGAGTPGETLAISCQNDTSGAITITNNNVSNKNINISTNGTDFTSGSDKILVSNITFSTSNSNTTAIALIGSYQQVYSNVAPGGSVGIWYWITIPESQPAGTYNGTISVKGE